ncbi:MAG: inorganic phosphate transporter, partial [Chloroflexi bacterium]|nr:inorganic phosphate transporter [Chloroflexota bacterium]
MMSPILIVMIVLSVIFDFLNGIHDSSNIVATMIASRAFKPRVALGITAVAHFVAPFIFGVAVATTIGHEVVAAEAITINVLIAALASAIIWNLLTWFLGIPSSSSHALIGGMIGAVTIGAGVSAIKLHGMEKILIALFISPVIGLILGYVFTKLVFF